MHIAAGWYRSPPWREGEIGNILAWQRRLWKILLLLYITYYRTYLVWKNLLSDIQINFNYLISEKNKCLGLTYYESDLTQLINAAIYWELLELKTDVYASSTYFRLEPNFCTWYCSKLVNFHSVILISVSKMLTNNMCRGISQPI